MSEPRISEEAQALVQRAANRLHHLSMRYSGALVALVKGQGAGLLPQGYPGLREARDLIDLMLMVRAEVNGLTQVLLDAGLLDAEKVGRRFAEEYEWLAQQKAAFLGVGVSDHGLTFGRRKGNHDD